MRFFITCVVLAVGCVAGVLYLAPLISSPQSEDKPAPSAEAKKRPVARDKSSAGDGAAAPRSGDGGDDRKVGIYKVRSALAGPQPIIIQDGRILATETQNVPSERDGKLVMLAVPVAAEEEVPEHLLIVQEIAVLAVRTTREEWEREPRATRLLPQEIPFDAVSGRKAETVYYRAARTSDEMAPGTTIIRWHKQRFRKLNEGDRVRKGDVLGVVNPEVALVEVQIKQAKVEASSADVGASRSMLAESRTRLSSAERANREARGTVSRDDIGALRVQVDRYASEVVAKGSAVTQSQRELAGSLATLNLYKLTAAIDGRVKTLYKNAGDAVKSLEPVLQLQNPLKLRVEAQVDVADAGPLRARLDLARKYRAEAQRLIDAARARRADAALPPAAREQLDLAARLVAIEVEASRPEPPMAELKGHLQDVTCVAVTKGKSPRIVSGSADQTVRLWEQAGLGRWQETVRLAHGAAVRAVACTGPKAKANLLLTATAAGRGRLFDLDNIDKGETELGGRHAGAINACAFNAEGTLCATAGEDKFLRVWAPASGRLMGFKANAHQAGITSLAFTSLGQIVTAGRDGRLVVWNVKVEGESASLEQADAQPDRSKEVPVLGVHPDGKHVLLDQGRELRVLSLETKKIEGAINNPGGASFSTMALFSPDGQTVLTNGSGPGRVQLWRAPIAGKRAAEVRQFLWANGTALCGSFAPEGDFAVTGTNDHRVLVWQMPREGESTAPLTGELTFVDSFTDTSLRKVTVRATFDNPSRNNPDGEIIPGGTATIVVPPLK